LRVQETTPWSPATIIDLIRAVPPGTFDSCLLAYGWNLIGQDAWPVMEECAKAVRNTPLFAPFMFKCIFYQDRLRTNIGKTQKRVAFFAGH
jgi:hypothetical protein